MNLAERAILYGMFLLVLVTLFQALGVTLTVDFVILFVLAMLAGLMLAYFVTYGFNRAG